ncbi:hypothetical protein QBC43DRAFT_312626 [Cladorrhinum sp. PSN259]|nr:hypothetical protein QBC43DRAFT_312626 [Cladorrhinum sp. PSN259]
MQSARRLSPDTIKRDVCIIGGGAAGTYAAIRLRDAGKTVAVVERSSKIGGGNRATTQPLLLRDSDITRNYYKRFNIGLETKKFNLLSDKAKEFRIVDFERGLLIQPNKYDKDGLALATKVRGFQGSIGEEALQHWAELLPKILQKIEKPQRAKGEKKPKPVMHIKHRPFAKVLSGPYSHAIAALADKFCKGYGDIYKLPIDNVVRNFGHSTLRGLKEGFLVPEDPTNERLYQLAEKELKNDLFLNFEAVSSVITDSEATIVVRDPQHQKDQITIQANKCLVTIPPYRDNFDFLDLALFKRKFLKEFKYAGYWTMIVSNTRLRDDIHFVGGTHFGSRKKTKSHRTWQCIYDIKPTGVPGTFELEFGFEGEGYDPVRTREFITQALRKLFINCNELFLPETQEDDVEPQFDFVKLHKPYGARIREKTIVKYGYTFEQSIQEHILSESSTVVGGAAFCGSHDASFIWEETEKLIRDRLLSDEGSARSYPPTALLGSEK